MSRATGLSALLHLRWTELTRTWRLWALPAVMVTLGASGPVLARYMNDILHGVLGAGAAALALPDPTWVDAYAQWSKNLSQLVVFMVVVTAAGTINAEVRSGVAALLLVKPASRTAYVTTHAGMLAAHTAVSAFLGAFVSWLVTTSFFADAPTAPLFAATAAWLVFALALIGASLLASATIDTVAGAAGIGIGVYFVLALLGIAPWLASYTPAGLISLVGALGAGQHVTAAAVWWPLGTGLALAAALLVAAVLAFRRREL
ncbi:MAG TPA: hypothetical protein VFU07_01325 [Candidatus Lumbricidophila sp.]|nr:hypothetical protein [Candidatus Lumbricidophila sp.]